MPLIDFFTGYPWLETETVRRQDRLFAATKSTPDVDPERRLRQLGWDEETQARNRGEIATEG